MHSPGVRLCISSRRTGGRPVSLASGEPDKRIKHCVVAPVDHLMIGLIVVGQNAAIAAGDTGILFLDEPAVLKAVMHKIERDFGQAAPTFGPVHQPL